MSDLQVWLLAIGVVIVMAVLVFNRFQEHRFRKQADAAFHMPVGDALMQPDAMQREPLDRIEPALHVPAFDSGSQQDEALVDYVPEASPVVERPQAAAGTIALDDAPPAPATPSRTSEISAPYDELIEYRVQLDCNGVQANALADTYNHTRTLGKAVYWAGLPAGATEWEEVQPWREVRYDRAVVTMQLADRNGAVQEDQLTALCDMLQTMAQIHGLRVACDDVVEALERAQAIDRFCVDVDVLIGLNVVARGEGSVNLARIVRQAEDSGMVLGVDGVFQLLDSRAEPLYALCNHDAEPFSPEIIEGQTSQGVTLQFDVPRVPDGVKVFDRMVSFGRKLANEVGGILVDDNLRPLTDTGIEKIRNQLMHIYKRMEARGVPSGSRRALRLFS